MKFIVVYFRKLRDCENTVGILAAKLSSIKQEAHKKRVSLLADLTTFIERQQKSYREFRKQVESMAGVAMVL